MNRLKLAAALLLATATPASLPADPLDLGPYIVFFDWNSADLSGKSKETLGYAADAFSRNGERLGNDLYLAGFADRSGPSGYNLTLSDLRTKSVRAYLIAQGIKPNRIVSVPFGEGEKLLRVTTADGVRDDQNRRVEIMFQPRR